VQTRTLFFLLALAFVGCHPTPDGDPPGESKQAGVQRAEALFNGVYRTVGLESTFASVTSPQVSVGTTIGLIEGDGVDTVPMSQVTHDFAVLSTNPPPDLFTIQYSDSLTNAPYAVNAFGELTVDGHRGALSYLGDMFAYNRLTTQTGLRGIHMRVGVLEGSNMSDADGIGRYHIIALELRVQNTTPPKYAAGVYRGEIELNGAGTVTQGHMSGDSLELGIDHPPSLSIPPLTYNYDFTGSEYRIGPDGSMDFDSTDLDLFGVMGDNGIFMLRPWDGVISSPDGSVLTQILVVGVPTSNSADPQLLAGGYNIVGVGFSPRMGRREVEPMLHPLLRSAIMAGSVQFDGRGGFTDLNLDLQQTDFSLSTPGQIRGSQPTTRFLASQYAVSPDGSVTVRTAGVTGIIVPDGSLAILPYTSSDWKGGWRGLWFAFRDLS
jgi:hypothetical protein